MKKGILFYILMSVFLINVFFIPSYILAYPEYGDCMNHHGTTTVNPLYDNDANIILDGVLNESFWATIKNQNSLIKIPTAQIEGGMGKVNISVYLFFVLTSDDILIYCEWLDNTTKPSGINIYDGIFFCWNIDTPRFTAYYPSDFMNTSHMGGGKVDSWGTTFFFGDNHENHSNFNGNDKCIQTNGWHAGENNDIQIGFTYIPDRSYSIEIKRKLITNDQYDVQFNEENLYLFNIGVINDGYDRDHSISWVYALDLTTENDNNEEDNKIIQKFNLGFLIINIIILMISISIVSFYYFSKRITE